MSGIPRVFTQIQKDTIIRNKIRGDDDIIYGARAMNAQILGQYQRPTVDFDVYSKSPKKRAKELEKVLDRKADGNYFYVKPAMHPGTFKVMDIGNDGRKGTMDDVGVADYTKPTRKIKTVKKLGVRYADVSERIKDAKKSIKDPMFKFRHDKDKKDIARVKLSKKTTRWFRW